MSNIINLQLTWVQSILENEPLRNEVLFRLTWWKPTVIETIRTLTLVENVVEWDTTQTYYIISDEDPIGTLDETQVYVITTQEIPNPITVEEAIQEDFRQERVKKRIEPTVKVVMSEMITAQQRTERDNLDEQIKQKEEGIAQQLESWIQVSTTIQ